MKLYIVRHGETEENKKDIIQGQMDGTLSELGILQAEKIAERLRDEHIDFAFSSDAGRTEKTAEIILKKHTDVDLVSDYILRERDYGMFTGMTHEERNEKYPGKTKEEIYAETDVETLESIYDRVNLFCNEIKKEYLGKSVLVVGHKHSNAELCRCVEGKEYLDKIDDSYKNASLTIYNISESGVECELFNDVGHLDGI